MPLKAWVKSALDRVVQGCFGATDLEFAWVGDDAVDPLAQATIAILVGAGVKTVAEARAELGLGGASGVAKFNPYHDERGRFTTAEGEVEPGTNENVRSDTEVADNSDRSPSLTASSSAADITLNRDAGFVSQDFTQTCSAYIAANCQARIIESLPWPISQPNVRRGDCRCEGRKSCRPIGSKASIRQSIQEVRP